MKEKLGSFEQRKNTLESKLEALSAAIDKKLSYNKTKILDSVEQQCKSFQETYRANVAMDIAELKQMGEVEYNFD